MAKGREIAEKTFKAIVQSVANGVSLRGAFEANGHSSSTYSSWLEKESEGKASAKMLNRINAIKKAQAQAEAESVAIVREAAQKTWQAAAWWLERTRKADYALTTKFEGGGKDSEPVKVIIERA